MKRLYLFPLYAVVFLLWLLAAVVVLLGYLVMGSMCYVSATPTYVLDWICGPVPGTERVR